MPRIGFVGPSYTLDTVDAACQRCVNMYLVPLDENNEPTKVMLLGTPGLKNRATIYAGEPVRGMIQAGINLLVVCGSTVYTLATDDTVTSRGTLNTSQGPVSMATNGTQVFIVDGVDGYIYTIATNTLSQITVPDFLGGDSAAFLDGYFVTNQIGTQNYQISSTYDGTAWDALDFAAAEGQPDNLVALVALNGQLWLFGETTSEVHYNSGDTDFPFAPVPGALIQKGCAAKYSPAVGNGTVYWLGNDRSVYRSAGYQAQKISTQAMDQAFAKYSAVSDAFGFVYVQEGHEFYVLSFPTEASTWVFDAMTQRWHERGDWDVDADDFALWRGSCAVQFNDLLYVGDYANGKVYTLDPSTVTDNGSNIVRMRRTPHASNTMLRLFHRSLTVVFQTGVNDMDSPDDEPQAALRWSNDAGHTWSNEQWRSLGAQGDYGKRVQWNRLGMARSRVYELKISDKIRPAILDDNIEVEAASS